jgi:hypothetical protein
MYEEGESGQRDEISFEGDLGILVLLQICKFLLDSFAFDFMLELLVY